MKYPPLFYFFYIKLLTKSRVAPIEDDGVNFEERMAEIHRELLTLQAESNDLMDTISQNLKELGL